MTPLLAVVCGYAALGVVYGAYKFLQTRARLKKSRVVLNIDGEAVDVTHEVAFLIGGIVVAVKEALFWPHGIVLDLVKKPEARSEDQPAEFHLDFSAYDLPRGSEYVREVKQVRSALEADVRRLAEREGRHKLVLADVLLDLAAELIDWELADGEANDETEEYLYAAVGRVLDGEVVRALEGQKPEDVRSELPKEDPPC